MTQDKHPDSHNGDTVDEERQSQEGRCMKGGMREDSIASRLLYSIRMFHKQEWDQHMISGYTPGEIRVLMGLRHHIEPNGPGMKVSEISSMMNVTSPTITQFINGLESKGLVERVMDAQDRRAVRVQLTEAGNRIVQQTYLKVKNNFNELVDFLGEEDSVKLTELLTKIYQFQEHKRNSNETTSDNE
ncbi:MarR family transcriptional regulator [Paenibacillus glucanolyticus]|jgi:DNA-binding MarR family transcriptional regulator|uniref:MarR family winged helix-turn-helix transcriptional regulator n=2 Tax=Paenibacillus TaxID=44249 RepID=UPI0004B25F74|nr:MarR family transcriptional regulator [Paenibacillus glucanolyticus]AVV56074.1 MarR family transcriptional regulator [Paenibacillus glucanolyticus]MPY19116.1 MarR family transcriptional regulator [Paenibacillus glucanolyticus]